MGAGTSREVGILLGCDVMRIGILLGWDLLGIGIL